MTKISNATIHQIGLAILTTILYAYVLGSWGTALLVMGAVGLHESCHLLAAKSLKLRTKGMYFIPFAGAVALMGDRYKSYWYQAIVVLAGPMGGGLGAVITCGLYLLTGIPWLAAAAFWMGFLNLINLAPLSFLDGGQLLNTITYSIHRTLGVLCLVISTVVGILFFMRVAPVIGGLIIIFGSLSVYNEVRNWFNWLKDRSWLLSETWIKPPKKLTILQASLTVACWFGSAFILISMMRFLSKIAPQQATFGYLFHR